MPSRGGLANIGDAALAHVLVYFDVQRPITPTLLEATDTVRKNGKKVPPKLAFASRMVLVPSRYNPCGPKNACRIERRCAQGTDACQPRKNPQPAFPKAAGKQYIKGAVPLIWRFLHRFLPFETYQPAGLHPPFPTIAPFACPAPLSLHWPPDPL